MIPVRGGCLLVFLLPFLELVVLLVAASTFGWVPVLLWILVSFAVGWGVVRAAAAATGRSWAEAVRLMQQKQAGDQDTPLAEIGAGPDAMAMPLPTPPAQTVLLVPAGLLIAIPGFLSDCAGLFMLIPQVRRAIAQRWAQRLNP